MIDTFKEFAPVLTTFTGLLIAFMSGFFFKKNKQTEYAMKLAEEAIEKVYNPILIRIEQNSRHYDGYEGLSFEEIEEIKKRFYQHRHLVDEKLLSMIWGFEEEARYRSQYAPEDIDYYDSDMFDEDGEFFYHLKFVRAKHLKVLGFSTRIHPSFIERIEKKINFSALLMKLRRRHRRFLRRKLKKQKKHN